MELTALTPDDLARLMPRDGRPSLARGKAVWRQLREAEPGTWPRPSTDLGQGAIDALAGRVRLPEVTMVERRDAADGTIKWRLACRGLPIETVMIPSPGTGRATVCVSSQSGCTRWCDFCATARMTFGGGLSAGEIVQQVMIARRAATAAGLPLTNVVFMGMGEPLDNLDAVLGAIRVIDQGLGIAPRHCTVSTSGVLPKMQRLWTESRASLALSLHATTQELRDRLMPRVKKWPLAALREWLVANADPKRPVFVEVALLAGVNDSEADAERLVAWLEGIPARVNLIPFNPTSHVPYRRPDRQVVRAFQRRVMAGGRLCIVRETRGDDALAACGQLAAG